MMQLELRVPSKASRDECKQHQDSANVLGSVGVGGAVPRQPDDMLTTLEDINLNTYSYVCG